MVPAKTLRTSPSLYEQFNFQKFAELTLSQIQKGSSTARSDDTKSLKGAILDWITPRGQYLNPPLARNVKTDRGFHHERTGALLCPAGLDWSNAELVLMLLIGHYADIL
jgi:hypothetical protein